MVFLHRCSPTTKPARVKRVAGTVAMVLLLGLASAAGLPAEDPGVHYLHQGAMPPGAIGSRQLLRREPLSGFFQPVEIKAPAGALISLAEQGDFGPSQPAPIEAGMLIAQVYRLRVMNIPLHPGMEVFPTVELIDRLYAPRGQELRFPIQIDLTMEDLVLALEGKFVTRVIYLEDPRGALPIAEDPQMQQWFEAGPGRDPLAMADQLGRPVAILRLGGRMPADGGGPDLQFLYGCPPVAKFPPRRAALPPAANQEGDCPDFRVNENGTVPFAASQEGRP
jgi:hypothetical protein